MPSGQNGSPDLPSRARFSLLGMLGAFFFIFMGLFLGFVVAYLFPEMVMRVMYGVETEAPMRVQNYSGETTSVAPSSGDRVGGGTDGRREREISMSSRLQGLEAPSSGLAPSAPNATPSAEFVVRRKPAPPVAAREPAVTPPQGRLPSQAVSSFLPALQYPMSQWRQIETRAGYVDHVRVAGTGAVVMAGERPGDATLNAADILDIAGWVGDPVLGVRFKDVVFSLCGKAVGHAKIGLPRPDVAGAVHPNLGSSGWQGRLYVGYLPRCADPVLHVWGVVPGTTTVLPVREPVPLKLPPADAVPANAPKGAPVFAPKNVVALRPTSIDVLADHAEMRRCGASNCQTVAQIAKGRYQGHVIEEADGWVLVVIPDKAGWLPRSQVAWAR